MTTIGSVSYGGSDTTSWTAAPPSGIQNGEHILAVVWTDADGDAMAPTGTEAAGWALKDSFVSGDWNCFIYFRKFTTGETSYGFSSGAFSSSYGHFYRVLDADDDAQVIAEFNNGTGTGSSELMTAPAIASYDGSDGVVVRGFVAFPGYSVGSFTTPTDHTSAGVTPTSGAEYFFISMYGAYQNLTGSPAIGTATTNGDNSDGDAYDWGACTVLVVNQGGGGEPPTGYPAPTVASGGRTTGGTGTTNTNTHTVTIPTGINGKLVVVLFAIDGNPTLSLNAASDQGWVFAGQASNSNVVTGAMFYKTANGDDDLVITSSAVEQSSYAVYVFDDASTVVNWAFANGSSTNSNPPACTVWKSEDYRVLAARMGDANVQATGAPSGFGTLTTRTGGTAGASIAVADRALNDITIDPGNFTSSSEQWVAMTVFIGKRHDLTDLVDDFNDNSIDTTLWQLNAGTINETGGQARPEAVAAGTVSQFSTMDWFHIPDDGWDLVFRMQPPSTSGSSNAYAFVRLFDYAHFGSSGLQGMLVFMDSVSQLLGIQTWDPTGSLVENVSFSYGKETIENNGAGGWFWLNFDPATGVIKFFISSNGRDWWRIYQFTMDAKFFASYRIYCSLAAYRTGGSQGTAAMFDNFQVPLTTPPDNAIFDALIPRLYAGG